MPDTHEFGVWKYVRITQSDERGKVARYKIHFYRQFPDGDWYDEIRYDSHEMKKGRDVRAPHLHMKLKSRFKIDDEVAIEEIKRIINNHLQEIEGVLAE